MDRRGELNLTLCDKNPFHDTCAEEFSTVQAEKEWHKKKEAASGEEEK